MGKIQKLEMIGIRKEFPGIVANDGIDFSIESGKIIGLLGENGAGKSTLMNILYGLYQPDAGEIRINGSPVQFFSPRDSTSHGIGMVHQHFMLINTHTVLENIAMALPHTPFFSPTTSVLERLGTCSEKYGLTVNPHAFIWELSAGEQQRVEILKALLAGSELLVLDEPTSVLTPMEAEDLLKTLKKMTTEGHSTIFITHKLEEILKVADSIIVLRQGKLAGSCPAAKTTKAELANLMVGRELNLTNDKKTGTPGKELLEISNLTVLHDKGRPAIKKLSFSIREGEIFGIAGVSGNGQKELAEAISGLRPIESGSIKLHDMDITNLGPRTISRCGVSHIPEERIRYGVVSALSLLENSILKDYDQPPFSNACCLHHKAIMERTTRIIETFNVSPPNPNVSIGNLSGGNIQKFLIGRELEGTPRLVIASHPTYGIDIGASQFIRRQLVKKRDEGCAILLISEDLEELFALADRLAVLFEGEFMGIFQEGAVKLETVGMMMAGTRLPGEHSCP